MEHAVAQVLGNGKDRQSFLKQSLRTKDRAEAKRRAPPVLMKFDGILARAASIASEQPVRATLSTFEIERMGAYYFALQLQRHDEFVRLGPQNERDERGLEMEDAVKEGRTPGPWVEPVPGYGLSDGQMFDVATRPLLRAETSVSSDAAAAAAPSRQHAPIAACWSPAVTRLRHAFPPHASASGIQLLPPNHGPLRL